MGVFFSKIRDSFVRMRVCFSKIEVSVVKMALFSKVRVCVVKMVLFSDCEFLLWKWQVFESGSLCCEKGCCFSNTNSHTQSISHSRNTNSHFQKLNSHFRNTNSHFHNKNSHFRKTNSIFTRKTLIIEKQTLIFEKNTGRLPFFLFEKVLVFQQLKRRLHEQILWQFLFARVDEQNWPIFIWQFYLLKIWRVSFYVADKNCHIQKIVRVDETTHKIGNFFMSSVDPSLQSFIFK